MASARSLAAVSVLAAASKQATLPSSSSSSTLHSLSSLRSKPRELSLRTIALKGAVKAQSNEAQVSPSPSPVGDAFSNVKHLLLPVIDRNPYLSEGTRQAAATTTSLANKYGADITVVVIDEEKRESSSEHETQVSNIRWHLSQGGFEEFKLLERLGEGKKATAVIGEVADELKMELVVMSTFGVIGDLWSIGFKMDAFEGFEWNKRLNSVGLKDAEERGSSGLIQAEKSS